MPSPGPCRSTTVRVADALRRGAVSHGLDGEPDVDFLALDWSTIADRPIDELRAALNVEPTSDAARRSGSVGPWEHGGISEFPLATDQEAAAREGRAYESFGATA